MKISTLGSLLVGCALTLPVDAVAAPLSARYGAEMPQPPALLVGEPFTGVSCPTLCRPAAPPCLSGSRWYGPYGYICYRYRPGPFVLAPAYGLR